MPGSDYRECPIQPYYIYKDILEVPVSIRPIKYFAPDSICSLKSFLHEIKWSRRVRDAWIRPTRNPSFIALKKVLDEVVQDSDYAMFMLHSSEMMPGGSPYFPDEQSIEKLYQCIERLFLYAKQRGYEGCKLSEYKIG